MNCGHGTPGFPYDIWTISYHELQGCRLTWCCNTTPSMTPLRPTFVKHEFYIAPICVDSVQINLTRLALKMKQATQCSEAVSPQTDQKCLD